MAVALAIAVVAAAAVAVRRVAGSPPAPDVTVSAGPALLPEPVGAPLALPAQGSLDVVVEGARLAGGPGPSPVVDRDATTVRAIGSIAKVMTALAVLDAHPLAVGQDGPAYTMTAQDVGLYRSALAAGGSTAPVAAGESFTERQLLLALLLPSGNNIAETLARWVGGTRAAFVATLNARAASL
ncbi:MAG TPA: D-alanyl-D-alanine carboxypeptidase, partial [Candidatus Dormibacteraeota bacterium]|nr:D-alanyl-D-alanine carboxypeptidase [Candidatus Dormibacteraeota bacterium]